MLKAIFSVIESTQIMECLTFSDKIQMVVAIKNLLKGSRVNSSWLIESGSYKTILKITK